MSDSESFQELLLRTRRGDEQAARELVERYEPAIRRAIRFRLADTRLTRLLDSMDICQSVLASFFLRAACGQYQLDDSQQLLRLLTAMARKKLAMHQRSQHRQRRDIRRVQSAGEDAELVLDRGASPSMCVAGQELIQQAERLLSAEERQLMEWRKQGLDWPAIAAQVGSTPEAVRKKHVRAVDRVAHALHLEDESQG